MPLGSRQPDKHRLTPPMPRTSVTTKATGSSDTKSIIWPNISLKDGLSSETIEQDQIIVLENFLTVPECQSLIHFVDALPLELTPPPKRGEATRVNHRTSISSPAFADILFGLLQPHLPSIASFQVHMTPSPKPIGCNPNIRLYKYTEGQYFGPHYDESVPGPLMPITTPQNEEVTEGIDTPKATGGRTKGKASRSVSATKKQPSSKPTWSEWTILIYLSGEEDGIIGGETVFYVIEGRGKSQSQRRIIPPLKRGSVLLHKHGKECLLHEGGLVERGTKYVLRSDLMFGQAP